MLEMGLYFFLYTLLLVFVSVMPVYSDDMVLSINEVFQLAKKNDSELKTLRFLKREIMRDKHNLYRSLFPSISTSLSRAEVLSYDEQDSKNYSFTLSFEQILYNQLGFPLSIKNHKLSEKEADLKIELRKKEIERKVSTIYMDILIQEESIKNSENGLLLQKNYLSLLKEEYSMGMKTLLDVVEAEKMVLEVELELKKFMAERDILYRDLKDLIGLQMEENNIKLKDNIDSIFSSFLGVVEPLSFNDFYYTVSDTAERILSIKELPNQAVVNNLEIEKMKLKLAQSILKRKLLSIQFLKNISMGYEIDFTGERFFPRNTVHTLFINFLFDFGGLFSSEVSLSETKQESMKSSTQSSSSTHFENLDPFNELRKIQIDIFSTEQNIREKEKNIIKSFDVWVINMKALVDEFEIQVKKENIFKKNEEIFELKLELGEIKKDEYLEFLLQKNEFLIELEKVKYRFINLLWDLESIMNMDIRKILN